MREMKNSGISWIGDIPAAWTMNTVFQLFSQVKNKNTELQEQNLLSLSYGKIKRKSIDSSEGLLPASFDGYNIIESGDIVLRLTDLQNDQRSLRVGLVTERGIITSAYCTIRPRHDNDSRFLYYFLHAFDCAKGFYGMGAGVRQGLNWDGLKWVKIALPSISEQKQIAQFLDEQSTEIDSLIQRTRASIAEYRKLKQSVITRAVTKGIYGDRPLVDTGLGWIDKMPETWHTGRIKGLFSFGKGLPITKDNLQEHGVPVISYGQIHAKSNSGVRIQQELIRFVSEEYLESNPTSLVHESDFIFADTSEDREGCGNCVYVNDEQTLFAGYHTIILRAREKKDNRFLAYLFKSDMWRSQIRSKVSGVKLFSISRKILGDASVLLPTDDEQKAISDYLDEICSEIDAVIAKKEQIVVELEKYKRAMVYNYVTGKKEVPMA